MLRYAPGAFGRARGRPVWKRIEQKPKLGRSAWRVTAGPLNHHPRLRNASTEGWRGLRSSAIVARPGRALRAYVSGVFDQMQRCCNRLHADGYRILCGQRYATEKCTIVDKKPRRSRPLLKRHLSARAADQPAETLRGRLWEPLSFQRWKICGFDCHRAGRPDASKLKTDPLL